MAEETRAAGSLKLNREQEAAVNCDRNVVVAAGAGSGKTSVLANRYVRLITRGGLRVDQILTLTFTRKAAAQMFRRIHGALGAEAGEAARIALRDFFHAHIQTLDSYCVYIVKQGASRYGIRPDFSVDNEGARELADRESLPFLISRLNHPALERLYREKRPQDIARDIFAASAFTYGFIDQAPSYTRGTAAQFGLICDEWKEARKTLLPLIDELAAYCAQDPQDKFHAQLNPLLDQFGALRDGITETDLREYFDTLLDSGDSSVTAAEAHPLRKQIIQWLFVLHHIAYARANVGKRNSEAKAAAVKLRRLFSGISSILVYVLQGGIILSVMILLDEFQQNYVEKKRAQGILTFTDAARLARTILREQKDIRNNEKALFKAIMIDEFQDNNMLQKELLFLLAEKQDRCADGIPETGELEEEKLFFVGDEKQSVYRFRGADVSVFRELKTELTAEDLNLSVNYRSSPELIALYNAVFGGSLCDSSGASPLLQYAAVFPPAAVPYEADYSPLKAGTDRAGSAAVYILDSGSSGDDDDGEEAGEQLKNDENEAAFIAAKIRDLLEERDEDGSPHYGADDIAILFRTRRPQYFFEKHLRFFHIPYAAEGLSSFFADGPVNDMAAFLRLIAYPLDTEAYAVYLRSPFAGLSLEGLALCIDDFNRTKGRAAGPVENKDRAGVREGGSTEEGQPFSATPALPDEADRRAWEQGGELYRRIKEKAAGLSIGQLLNELWYQEGYRYETTWNPGTRAHRELFDYLYSQALKADEQGLSIAAFSDRLEALREQEETLDDTEIPLERSGAVRLLTVHKSKGLEFKVVFIVCCGKRSRGTGNYGDLYYSAAHDSLSFNPPLPPECAGLDKIKRNFFYEQDRQEELRRETAELRRLLYVAMTRARERLFLSGSFPLGDGDLLTGLTEAVKKKIALKDEENAKQGFDTLEGDRILDNGTFFGLLLPVLAEPRGTDSAESGAWPPYLQFGPIPRLTTEELRNREHREPHYPNTRSGLDRFLRDAGPLYAGARVLHSPVIGPDHLNASAAGQTLPGEGGIGRVDGGKGDGEASGGGGRWRHDPVLSGRPAADIFERVDPILSKNGPERGFAEFGTLAHLCVEELLPSPGQDSREARIPPGLAGRFGPAETQILLDAGRDIAGRFLASPLGEAARAAPFRRGEYPFRCLWHGRPADARLRARIREGAATGNSPIEDGLAGNIFINGVIDLLFEWDNEVRVVDFKTDSSERPEEHLAQMAIYRRAAGELRGKNCRVWLYYLRSGRAVEIEDFGDFDWQSD